MASYSLQCCQSCSEWYNENRMIFGAIHNWVEPRLHHLLNFLHLKKNCGDPSAGMQDLVPWLGIEPTPSALEVQSLNCWTAKEVSTYWFLTWGRVS